MSKVINYSNYLNEADEDPKKVRFEKRLNRIFISKRLQDILKKMIKIQDFQVKTVANRILSLQDSDELFDFSYLDLSKEGTDMTFMPSARIWRLLDATTQDEADMRALDNNIVWTHETQRQTLGVGKMINKLFDDFSQIAVDKFVNSYRAEITALFIYDRFKLVKGEDIRYWYDGRRYSDTQNTGTLAGSCMIGAGSQPFFDIYCNNPEACNLLILTGVDNKLIGRALVWHGSRKPVGGKTFMDRIYASATDTELFIKYANEHGWLYKYAQSAQDQSYMEKGQKIGTGLAFSLKQGEYKKYPYMDTLKYYTPGTGRIGSDAGNRVEGMKRIKMEAGDGSFQKID